MWAHFESVHVTVLPTYTSMYFPAPASCSPPARFLFGNPWIGILLTTALMCAAICWALQAWLPPTWALLGGFLAVLRIGLFSYWIRHLHRRGAHRRTRRSARPRSLPRLTRTGHMRYSVLMGLGISMLVLSRPYEELSSDPCRRGAGHWILRGKNRPPALVLLRRAAVPFAFVAATLAWLGYYDYRRSATQRRCPSPSTRTTYAVVPYYVWQPPHPAPHYTTAELRRFYTVREAQDFYLLHRRGGWPVFYGKKLSTVLFFFCGIILLPPLFWFGRVFRDRRLRFFAWSLPFWVAGTAMSVYTIPHYLAPFTVAAYILGIQALRHLRAATAGGGAPVGRTFVRLAVTVCIVMAGLRAFSAPLHLAPSQSSIGAWEDTWLGPGHFGAQRAAIVNKLDRIPGNHLVLVRYESSHDPMDEWVYNDANIDGSRIIWARDMDAVSNQELIRFYGDRDVWLVQPDAARGRLSPYPNSPALMAAGMRKP